MVQLYFLRSRCDVSESQMVELVDVAVLPEVVAQEVERRPAVASALIVADVMNIKLMTVVLRIAS